MNQESSAQTQAQSQAQSQDQSQDQSQIVRSIGQSNGKAPGRKQSVKAKAKAGKILADLNQEVSGAIAESKKSGMHGIAQTLEAHRDEFDGKADLIADAIQPMLDPRMVFLAGVNRALENIGNLETKDFLLPTSEDWQLPSMSSVLSSRRSLSQSRPDSWDSESDIGLEELEVEATEIN